MRLVGGGAYGVWVLVLGMESESQELENRFRVGPGKFQACKLQVAASEICPDGVFMWPCCWRPHTGAIDVGIMMMRPRHNRTYDEG